jgi:hypothetical protein
MYGIAALIFGAAAFATLASAGIATCLLRVRRRGNGPRSTYVRDPRTVQRINDIATESVANTGATQIGDLARSLLNAAALDGEYEMEAIRRTRANSRGAH